MVRQLSVQPCATSIKWRCGLSDVKVSAYHREAGHSKTLSWMRSSLLFSSLQLLVLLLLCGWLVWRQGPTLRKHDCETEYYHPSCWLHRGDKSSYKQFLASAGKLLPSAVHATIRPEDLGSGRLLVVGDVHSCREELQDLLEKTDFCAGTDNLVLVGDLVEKGPLPVEVVEDVMHMERAWSVRGNHDDSGLGAYEAFQRGDGDEVREKHRWARELPEPAARWLASLPWTFTIPSHSLIVVHAGVVPEVPLSTQLLVDLYRMRELKKGKHGWIAMEAKDHRGEGYAWAEVWAGPYHVAFGHDHQRGLQEEKYATGLDTGVCYGDRLTGLLLPSVDEVSHRRSEWNTSDGVTLEMLGGKLLSVPSRQAYWSAELD